MTALTLSKLTAPRLGKIYLRTRLFKTLDQASDKPVIWIAAPAGYGKTTLVASYLQQKRIKPLWYQVDEGDADLASFFYYMGMHGKQAVPRRKKQLPLLTPEYLLGLPTFTRNFFREFFTCMKARGVLVFDNFQDAGSDVPLHQVLPQALAEIPRGINVVIVSRTDPPASLARLQASDEMAVLRWDDLRLTEEEGIGIGTLRSQGKQSNEALYRDLTKLTDGWVTGLVLYLEHAAGTDVPDAIKQHPDQKAIFDYFAGEIMDRLDARSQTIVQCTAFLPRISATTARELSGDPTADRLLDELADRNAFTVRHNESETTYEYHPLYREFLQARARQTLGTKELNALLHESASQLESTGYIEDAVELLQQAQDWSGSARLILGAAQILIEQGRGMTVHEWIRLIPDDILTNQPWLLYWYGIAKLPYNPPDARATLEMAYHRFKDSKESTGMLLAWCAIIDTFIFEYGDFHPLDHWIAEVRPYVSGEAEFPSPEIGARVACAIFIALMNRQLDNPALPRWEARVEELVLHGSDPNLRIQIGPHFLLYCCWFRGELAKARTVYFALEPLMSGEHVPPYVFTTWSFMSGAYSWIDADSDRTLLHVTAGLARAKESGVHIWDVFTYLNAGMATLTSGRYTEARSYLDAMKSIIAPTRYVDNMGYYHLAAWNAFLHYRLDEASECSELALQNAKKSGNGFYICIGNDQLSKIRLYQGRTDEAEALNREATTEFRQDRSATGEYLTLLTTYEIALAQRGSESSLLALRNFLDAARRFNVRNHTGWIPNVMSRLYAHALVNQIEPDYVRSMIRQHGLLPPDDLSAPATWPFPVKVYTLGRFSLVIDDEPVGFKGKAPRKALELFKALIAFGGRDISIEQLSDALWPDAEGDAAYQAFTMALQRLRKLLVHKDALVLTEGKLSLDPRYAWVDVWAFERGLGESEPEKLDKTLRLYKGAFLEHEPADSWLLSTREHLQQRFLRALARHGENLEQTGRNDEAVAIFECGVEVDPLAESFYQGLMRCHNRLGYQVEAMKVYERCKTVINQQLGVEPSDQTLAVYLAIQKNA